MGIFSRLTGNIAAKAGSRPQIVTPTGWALDGVGQIKPQTLAFAASITPDLDNGCWLIVDISVAATAFVVENPTLGGAVWSSAIAPIGQTIGLTFYNTSGGAMGGVTFGSLWKQGGVGFVAPTNGQIVSALFNVFSATQIVAVTNWSGGYVL